MEVIKKIVNKLAYDSELINTIKQDCLGKDRLYNLLINGKISLKEYLAIV